MAASSSTTKKKIQKSNKPRDMGGPKLHKSSKKDFKTKAKSNDSSSSFKSQAVAAAALRLDDDVPDFPRGGGSLVSRKERDEVRDGVDAEFDQDELRNNKNKKKKRKQQQQINNQPTEDDLGSLFGDGITGKLPRFVNKITLKNITPEMKLWGVIAEVNEKDLEISLPGGIRGLVRASEAMDSVVFDEVKDSEGNFLPSIFHVGQLVSCIVLQVDDDKKEKGKRKIWLSLRLSLLHKGFTFDAVQEGMVLTAYVKSIEDHGYILHFGQPSFMGFLPKNSIAGSVENQLKNGHIVQGVVRTLDKARKVVHLSSDPDTVAKCVTKDLKGVSMDLLVPGMMVDARVRTNLENGIMLSFLTFFTGTVDLFHLQNSFPTANWKDDYSQNKKVNARILFIDPSTRAVGLTLNPHLVCNKAPPSNVKTGDIFEHSKVVRVDRGLGILLEIPSTSVPTPAYVGTYDVAEEVQKLEKKFKEGTRVRVRILGFRHLEGLATGTLKGSAFEGSVFTHSDIRPGMVVRAKVIVVDSFGAIVQFPSGMKALCPLPHMSEFEIVKPGKTFKVGAELVFRVLGCKSKRITVTHKKTLVKSKLEILSSYADAVEGLITHGWITKIEKHGCFVRFYNKVQGFASSSQLGLEPGCDTSSMYHVGQVVKCRVTSSVPASRRINLSFIIKPTSVSEDDMVKLGSLVSGVVERVTPSSIVVCTNAKGYSKGTISTEHLSDHHGIAVLMKSALKPGYEFDQLLVLEVEGNNLILTAKHSLVSSAEQLPLDHSQIRPNSVVHGYICNVIETGCFVRFLGRLTGFSPRKKAMDDQRADLSESFYVGQSVRSNIIDVASETGRITLSLKQSCCASTDASFMQEYFLFEEKIAKLQLLDSQVSDLKWVEDLHIGSIVDGKIHEVKDFGVVISFEKYKDVYGFITHYQLGGTNAGTGSAVQAAVLDIAKAESLVDLSLKPEFFDKLKEQDSINEKSKKKRKREAGKDLELHQKVNAVVEIVKENYLVLSIPDYKHAIGYASVTDYNTQKLPHKQFLNGQSVIATVMALPSPSTSGRLLLLLNSISEAFETSSSKKAKKKSSYNVGSLVQAEITEIRPLELRVNFGVGFHGKIRVTEASGDNNVEYPFNNFKVGQTLTARIVGKAEKSETNSRSYIWELSLKPVVLAGSSEIGDMLATKDFSFSTGQCVTGYVYKVDSEWVWLTISRHVNAQIFLLDSACEPSELNEFQKRFNVGKAVAGHILSVNKAKKLLRLVLRPLNDVSIGAHDGKVLNTDASSSDRSNENVTAHMFEGDMVGGRISKILPGLGGLLVQIGPHLYGKVHFTELTTSWVSDPLSGYHEGQFVKCKVLEISRSAKGTVQVDLSLCTILDGLNCQKSGGLSNNGASAYNRVESVEDLHPNSVVQGYVKNVTSKGCFVMLSRKLDAKILLSNLSDGYVEDLTKEFPVGKLVIGRVLSVEPLSRRVEVTLKTPGASRTPKSEIYDLSNVHVGDIISGRIKRVESFGLFITMDHTNMVGLCHVSEVSDDQVDNFETKYKAGDRVTAKILKVDEERHRISLGMKNSYIKDDIDTGTSTKQTSDEAIEGNISFDDTQLTMSPESNLTGSQDVDSNSENGEFPILAKVESRASVLPLEVTLDDVELSDVDNIVSHDEKFIDAAGTMNNKNERRANKKAKAEREEEIRVAEERQLERDIPRNAEEYERLLKTSPDSSFVWIKYMEFMLSLSDVEKGRSIAERALRTISMQSEEEKLNVWVAYLNLENKYGNPPEEAVKKIFQRALQYCDSEKIHLRLLEIYESTKQHKLAAELLDKMTKKFRQSEKVWLRKVELLLKQKQEVQSVVNRALLSLPRNRHIEFMSQAAILEYKCGVPERGRSMFEGILREYPKKSDLWSIYLDQEIRLGDVVSIRLLFERATSLSLPNKKIMSLLVKYLKYETSLGNEDRIEYVKRKAHEYKPSANV